MLRSALALRARETVGGVNVAKELRIGCGAGFAGDRLEPAVVLAEQAALDVLVLECLAERTIALAQLRKHRDPGAGYDPLLDRRIAPLLRPLKRNSVRLISNLGAADPLAAARRIAALAADQGLAFKIAAVLGDDVLARVDPSWPALESGRPLASYGAPISANAYLGIDALLPALAAGAEIIVTGRVADPSLFLAPIVDRFGWALDDHDRLAAGTVVGHLLECAGQLCGGYFADPGRKDVPGLARLGFPYAVVAANGDARFAKVAGTGGMITLATATEQLLYEVTDPAAYVTPDVVADFSRVRLRQEAHDHVSATGARAAAPRPAQLKVSIGYHAGHVGIGEIGYAGENCAARARLAGAIVAERLAGTLPELRVDLIGSTALHGRSLFADERPYEVRLRVAGRAPTPALAARVGEEVVALYTNGPAGGGGASADVREQVGIVSCLIDRAAVTPSVAWIG